MYIDTVQKADRVSAARIVNEAERWGMASKVAQQTVDDTLERLPAAISQTAEEIDAPEALLELVGKRVEGLR